MRHASVRRRIYAVLVHDWGESLDIGKRVNERIVAVVEGCVEHEPILAIRAEVRS